MPFTDIVGHPTQLEKLRRALRSDRLHHAYLFLGPRGVGKRTVALTVAQAIFCEIQNYDACGKCVTCVRIREGRHPDMHLVGPPAGKREINIQQIRDLQKELSFQPFSGIKKVAILDPADLMNYHAQNALLKTLEEPPGDSILIMIATQPKTLLPTLLSRCLRLPFGLLPFELACDFLIQRREISPERARVLAALTMGSPGEALTCSATDLIEERRGWMRHLCSLSRGGYQKIFLLAEEMAGDKEKSARFIQWIESWYQDILTFQVSGEAIRNVDLAPEISEQASSGQIEETLSSLFRLTETMQALQKNYNRRMIFEDFLVKVSGTL